MPTLFIPALAAKWQCCECDEVHDYEEDALECCRPGIREIYECPVCADIHDCSGDALACCGHDPDGPPRPPTAAELEAAGQMRLALEAC